MPANPKCPECGADLTGAAPGAPCVQCLLGLGLNHSSDTTTVSAAEPPNTAQATTVTEQPGDRIGRYKLLQKIGEGGCGVVYMAEQQEPIRRRVALKVIKLGMDTVSVIARFEAERQALALMDHPNIAKVLDAGATEIPHPASGHPLRSDGRGAGGEGLSYLPAGRPYFVMELVRGTRITDYCDQNNLSTRERLNLFTQVCHALQHAHQKGVIHRDIKPSNILVTLHDGVPVPKVIDFGIAKATSDQRLTDKTLFTAFEQFIGTPAYMSPEQAELSGLDIDTRSDVYALGVLLYELLTGRTPFDARRLLKVGLDEIRRIIREEEPPRPSTCLSTLTQADLTTIAKQHRAEPSKLTSLTRGDLDWIVMKCLEKDRTRRYETANALAADVQRHLTNEPVVAGPPSNLYRFGKMLRRNKLAAAAAAAVALALIAGFTVSTWQAVRAARAEQEQRHLRLAAQTAQANESTLRQQSEASELTARNEARRAAAAASELKMTLATSDFFQAVRLINEGNGVDALPYLARSLAANPSNAAVSTRAISLLTYHTWMVPVLEIPQTNGVYGAEFSPDGTRIVTASRMGARLWEARTGQPLKPFLHPGAGVSSAHFSPDGVYVVTASLDGTARVWNAETGEAATPPLTHSNSVRTAHFSPDGKRIVTASADQTVRVWDAESGQPLTKPFPHVNQVGSARFSPDGTRLVTTAGTSAQVLDAVTGVKLAGPFHNTFWGILSAEWSPDGTRIVTTSGDKTACVWDVKTGQLRVGPLQQSGPIVSARFSPDGRRIVTASADNSARVWDASTGLPTTELLKHGEWVLSAEFSPDGGRIVTASRDNIVRVWEILGGPALPESLKHTGAVSSAQFSANGKKIVTASADHTAQVWDSNTGQPLTPPLGHGDWVLSAQFSRDGAQIVTASMDNTARVWDTQNGRELTGPLRHRSWKYSGSDVVPLAVFAPDGNQVLTAGDDIARVWQIPTGAIVVQTGRHKNTVTSARFSPDGRRIVTGSWDKTARVWDAQNGQPLTDPLPHAGAVTSVQFSPDGQRILSSSADNTARIWDAQTGQALTDPLRHSDGVISAEFSPDGRKVVTASHDHTARVWDAQTGRPLTFPLKHSHFVFSARFSPDGARILTASRDFSARLWDAQTGEEISEPFQHNNWVMSARFSPDGRRIVTASYDNSARIWDVAPSRAECPEWFLPLIEAVSGQVLNAQGILEATSVNRHERLTQLRRMLDQAPDEDWAVWGRWFLEDPSLRAISPFSSTRKAQRNPAR